MTGPDGNDPVLTGTVRSARPSRSLFYALRCRTATSIQQGRRMARCYGIPIRVQREAYRRQPRAYWLHGQRYRIPQVLGTGHLRTRRWEGPEKHTDREYFRVVTADNQVFELYYDDAFILWVLDGVQD